MELHDQRLPIQLAEIATVHFIAYIIGTHPELLTNFFVDHMAKCRDADELKNFTRNSVPSLDVSGNLLKLIALNWTKLHKLWVTTK